MRILVFTFSKRPSAVIIILFALGSTSMVLTNESWAWVTISKVTSIVTNDDFGTLPPFNVTIVKDAATKGDRAFQMWVVSSWTSHVEAE